MQGKVLTIIQLNNYIKSMLDSDQMLAGLQVKGELSNYKTYPSGHHYFSMKDTDSTLKCVMFKGHASKLRFKPENGMSVIATGNVQVYTRDGVYQLYVSGIMPDGIGDLAVAFEQLKEKLRGEGLFDEKHKKPLPTFPNEIAIITSSAGAAIEDIQRVLKSRWPMTNVVLFPVRVQGDRAPGEIIDALRQVNEIGKSDIIITGRGGGSIEDLWAFNDEGVARAIFASKIPVISAVGHEPDFTISDFVADVRAATPSNAAEIAVPDKLDVISTIAGTKHRLSQSSLRVIKTKKQQLFDLKSRRILRSPKYYVDDRKIHTDRLAERLSAAMQKKFHVQRERFARLSTALDAMSPLKVLGRGYAIAKSQNGNIIKRAADVKAGDNIKVRLKEDEISCSVL